LDTAWRTAVDLALTDARWTPGTGKVTVELSRGWEVGHAENWVTLAILVGAIVVVGTLGLAQQEKYADLAAEQRLIALAGTMRVSLSMAAFAAFSPSVSDAHGQAERLIVLLRGDADDKVPRLLQEAEMLPEWIVARALDPERERILLGAAQNVRAFLRLALGAAISASRGRTLDPAIEDLFRVYACLLAAWGQSVDGIAVPGLVMVLRAFDIPVTV